MKSVRPSLSSEEVVVLPEEIPPIRKTSSVRKNVSVRGKAEACFSNHGLQGKREISEPAVTSQE